MYETSVLIETRQHILDRHITSTCNTLDCVSRKKHYDKKIHDDKNFTSGLCGLKAELWINLDYLFSIHSFREQISFAFVAITSKADSYSF